MRFIVQVRIEPDGASVDGRSADGEVVEVAVVERDELWPASLGLSIEDAKTILVGVQHTVVVEHCAAALATVSCCETCGRRFAHKHERGLVVRTLYGKVGVANPRWWTCPCHAQPRSWSPSMAVTSTPATRRRRDATAGSKPCAAP
jgi:hypothetical protein